MIIHSDSFVELAMCNISIAIIIIIIIMIRFPYLSIYERFLSFSSNYDSRPY